MEPLLGLPVACWRTVCHSIEDWQAGTHSETFLSPRRTTMANELATAVGQGLNRELTDALARIQHCLGQLTDEQVWWRPAETMNSVGNLLLHLAGNVRQWIVCGVGGGADSRNRPAEFAERRHVP